MAGEEALLARLKVVEDCNADDRNLVPLHLRVEGDFDSPKMCMSGYWIFVEEKKPLTVRSSNSSTSYNSSLIVGRGTYFSELN